VLSLPKVKRQPIANQVYETVREAIYRGDMTPGRHLSEVELSKQMGVSRAPVREALLQLEAEGIVELVPNKGAFVRGLSYEEVKEIYTARALLEGYAAALAAERAEPDDVNKIIKAAEEAKEAAGSGDLKKTLNADFIFHRKVWAVAGHSLIESMLERLESQIRAFMVVQAPLFSELLNSVLDHMEIATAIEKQDPIAARKNMERHINTAGKKVLAWLESD
jgi:DNA-binding GntR family transcriptional regulator